MNDEVPARGLRDLADIDAIFTALAHPVRRHVLQVLFARRGSMTAGELAARFSHSWPTTTRHLGVLVDAGLVTVAREGRQRRYVLDRPRLATVLDLWLSAVGYGLTDTNPSRPDHSRGRLRPPS